MDKRSKLIAYLVGIIIIIGLVYLAYLIDSNRIASHADVKSTASVENLQELPSPDESIISKIYSAIVEPFSR